MFHKMQVKVFCKVDRRVAKFYIFINHISVFNFYRKNLSQAKKKNNNRRNLLFCDFFVFSLHHDNVAFC